MAATSIKNPESVLPYAHLVTSTIEACEIAKGAAGLAAEGIATGSAPLLNSIRERERTLDKMDMEVDAGVTMAITKVS
ncbi:MAG: hypothetical protein ACHP8A_06895, partial [Terriglobales bacterium]